MTEEAKDVTVQVSIQRRLLWEMRNRYDEATVDDILRVIHCARYEMKYGTICGRVIIWFVFVLLLAVNIPGPVLAQWPLLAPITLFTVFIYRRAHRKMLPYGRVREAIVHADEEKFKRIADELGPLKKEYIKGECENVAVSIRL